MRAAEERSDGWKQARSKLSRAHIAEAALWVKTRCRDNDFSYLYEVTGCRAPRHRFASYGGDRFPAKAFGYLVLMKAGWGREDDYRPTVNEVMSPIRKLEVTDAQQLAQQSDVQPHRLAADRQGSQEAASVIATLPHFI